MAADAHTKRILDDYGIDFRPPEDTSLILLATGEIVPLDLTRKRWIFSSHARSRAAEMAAWFDAYLAAEKPDALRHAVLRTPLTKVSRGELASSIRAFARLYDRQIGRLVTAGQVRSLLSVLHLRFDTTLDVYDLHCHAIWQVSDHHLDDVFIAMGRHFSDPRLEAVEEPGALANYAGGEVIDFRRVPEWPPEVIREIYALPPLRLIRPAGAFRAFRRDHAGYRPVRRDNTVVLDKIEIATRCPRFRRAAADREQGERIFFPSHLIRVRGEKRACAVLKSARARA